VLYYTLPRKDWKWDAICRSFEMNDLGDMDAEQRFPFFYFVVFHVSSTFTWQIVDTSSDVKDQKRVSGYRERNEKGISERDDM